MTAAQRGITANQLADAWARITQIADAAPANPTGGSPSTRLPMLAGGLGARKQRRRLPPAWRPDAVGIEDRARLRSRWQTTALSRRSAWSNELLALYPEDWRVRRLARELEAQPGRWVLESEAKPSDSGGGGANASGQALTMQTRLTTRPSPTIGGCSRSPIMQRPSTRRFCQPHPAQRRPGVAHPYLTATLYPTQSWGTLTKAGGVATLDWRATDQIGSPSPASFIPGTRRCGPCCSA